MTPTHFRYTILRAYVLCMPTPTIIFKSEADQSVEFAKQIYSNSEFLTKLTYG